MTEQDSLKLLKQYADKHHICCADLEKWYRDEYLTAYEYCDRLIDRIQER